MSASARRRQHVLNPRQTIVRSPHLGTETQQDGSLLVSVEQLERLGNGDAEVGRRELRLLLALEREGPVLSGPTAKPASVRIAGPQDEEALVALWLQDLREDAEHVAPIDEAKVLESIRAGTRRRSGVVACIDADGKPVALLVLIPLQWHWSQSWFLQEMCAYVHPDYRRSKFADDLIAFAKFSSDYLSSTSGIRFYLLCGVLGTWRIRAKVAMYRRKVSQVGSVHCYPAPPMKGS